MTPVTFTPGRPILFIIPSFTGYLMAAKTTGIVVDVGFTAAIAQGEVMANIKPTFLFIYS